MIIGKNFSKIYLYAHKFEKLTVIRQFNPFFASDITKNQAVKEEARKLYFQHCRKYGNSIIVEGNRFPVNGYNLIDKRWFNNFKVKYTQENLIKELFLSAYTTLGYIDSFELNAN